MGEETVSKNFIEQIIEKDLAEANTIRSVLVFRRNQMAICISDMPKPFC